MVREGGRRSHHVVVGARGHEVVVQHVVLHHEASHRGHLWGHHRGQLLGYVSRTIGARFELVDGRRRARLRGPRG